MITTTEQVDLAASPEAVFAYLTDLTRWPEWFAFHRAFSGEIPTVIVPGVRFHERIAALGIPGEIDWELLEVQAAAMLALKGRGTSRTSIDLEVRLQAAGTGTHVELTVELGGLALAPLKSRLAAEVDRKADRSLAQLAERLSGESTQTTIKEHAT